MNFCLIVIFAAAAAFAALLFYHLSYRRQSTRLSTYFETKIESEKLRVSRELHDELGGILVAARMDVSWIRQKFPSQDAMLEERFARIQKTLTSGVEFKRRIVEELHPTLLDHVGLVAALRWQVKTAAESLGLILKESYPEQEPAVRADDALGMFRVAQESLSLIAKRLRASEVELAIEADDETLIVKIADDGALGTEEAEEELKLDWMRYRVRRMRGRLSVARTENGTTLSASIPLVQSAANPGQA